MQTAKAEPIHNGRGWTVQRNVVRLTQQPYKSKKYCKDNNNWEKCLLGWFKGKKKANSAELQVQELEEQEELEKRLEMARTEKIAALLPEEWEELQKADEAAGLALAQRLCQIREANESVECAQTLCLRIEQGKATDYNNTETVELLGRAEPPDAEDVPDEELELSDESMDPEADLKEVEGTRKRKQGSLEWGFSREGACENCHKQGKNCLVTKNDQYQAYQQCRQKKICCPFVTKPVWTVRKNATTGILECPGRPVAAEEDFMVPEDCHTQIDDLHADVSTLMEHVRQLETSEELSRTPEQRPEPPSGAPVPSCCNNSKEGGLDGKIKSGIAELLIYQIPTLLNTEGLHGEEPVTGGFKVEKRKKRRVMVVVEVKRPSNHPTTPSKCPDSILTPESEEDTEGEMDVDRPEPDRPEPSHPGQRIWAVWRWTDPQWNRSQRWRGQLRRRCWRDQPGKKQRRWRRKGRRQKQANEDPQIKVLLAQLHARHEEIKAKLVAKPKKFIMKELPPDAILLAEPPTGFWSGLRPDGIVKFVSDDNDEPVASGSGTRPDPDLKED
ncbi:hypothetical protein B0H14DRAFT_2568203 [Mycena olivaceomarginata]|nr:hypothetical protein B0H14DRAFT_2568203 [Mycena olivaceomarginata]